MGFPHLKLRIKDLSKIGARFGIESTCGRWDAKITTGIMGVHKILGQDYGIGEPLYTSVVAFKIHCMTHKK